MFMTQGEVFIYLILGIVILFGLFLLLRELNCWYWKINRRIELQERTNDLLNKILEEMRGCKEHQDPSNQE